MSSLFHAVDMPELRIDARLFGSPSPEHIGVWTEGDPFLGVRSGTYWSSLDDGGGPSSFAWAVSLSNGFVFLVPKPDPPLVWPVRDIQ